MAEALDRANNFPIYIESQPLKCSQKTAKTNPESEGCSLVSTICNTFSCQKFSCKIPTELPKYVHFRLTQDDPIHVKRPASFLEFDFESTYIPRFDLSDELLYQIEVPLSTETESKLDDTCPWSEELSDELLYEVAAQFSD